MEKYIIELIKEHNRVIVPNFGAFIVSRERGQTILFNSFLSFNDGLLINYIIKTDGIGTDEASAKVDDYVKSINSALDQKGVYNMDNLGKFTKDQNGILRFVQTESEIGIKPGTQIIAPPPKAPVTDLLDIDTSVSVKEEPLDETKTFKPKETVSKENLIDIDNVKKAQANIKPEVQKDEKKTVKPTAAARPKVEKEKVIKERRSLPLGVVVTLITLPVILVLAYFLFFKDGISLFSRKRPEVSEQPVIKPLEEAEPIIEPQPKIEPPKTVIAPRQHHIIIGSFNDEKRANELAEKIRAKGLTDVAVKNYNDRFLVSAEWHTSVNKALERQEELLKELQMENWVLTIK